MRRYANQDCWLLLLCGELAVHHARVEVTPQTQSIARPHERGSVSHV